MAFQGHWQEMGQGRPVLCLSGFASSHWMFPPLLQSLTPHYRFILPDNRGMGASPPARQPYRLADLAADGLQLMDDLGYARFAIIGLSMGGFIAQLIALHHGARVEKMVLLCSSSSGELFKPLFPVLSRQQVAAIYGMKAAERIRAALAPQFCPLLVGSYPEVYDFIFHQRLAHEEDVDQVMMQYDAVADFLATPLPLARITCPTLVLAGEEDRIVPPANAHLLGRLLPQATVKIVPHTDHLFFLEQVNQVALMLDRFFQQA